MTNNAAMISHGRSSGGSSAGDPLDQFRAISSACLPLSGALEWRRVPLGSAQSAYWVGSERFEAKQCSPPTLFPPTKVGKTLRELASSVVGVSSLCVQQYQ